MRVKGPNVTPGYWNAPDLTRSAFDEEGFYRTGDAGIFLDAGIPEKGILFNGRIAEDFKLLTGTWVHVGALRVEIIAACSPAVTDAVITGHNADAVGALLFPNIKGCKRLFKKNPPAETAELLRSPRVRNHVLERLRAHNARHPQSSTRIVRALLLADPPDLDANEITDKGYLNQRAILKNRAHVVRRLHQAKGDDPDVLFP